MLDLTIPVYPGPYQMDKDSLQAEMDTVRARIIRAALRTEERLAVQYALQRVDSGASLAEITEAQVREVARLLPERNTWRDERGYTVAELLDQFASLRAQVLA